MFVRLQLSDDEVILEVEDDGIGFTFPDRWVELARQEHPGLIGVSERAELVGGKMNITSSPGKGTSIQVIISRTYQEEIWNGQGAQNETVEKKLWDLSV
ncbi:MAG: hypothetical protein PHQ40_12035 [Anaerolineaceae bacterium]|nr:hypothetical protein [Anaerolineaceae bacterium]